MLRHLIREVLLVALLPLTPVSADDFTVLRDAVQGEVRISGSEKPAARVRLGFYDDKVGVVSGDDGRFRWPIPAGSNVTAGGRRATRSTVPGVRVRRAGLVLETRQRQFWVKRIQRTANPGTALGVFEVHLVGA
jgi:hypothetical protein